MNHSFAVAVKILLICLILCVLQQAALAARGGSSRGGSSRSYGGRSSRYSRVGSYSRLSSLVFSGFSRTIKYRAFRSGYYLSSLTWRRSHTDLGDDTRICFNVVDALPSEYNSSVQVPWIYQNRTTYGVFVCPLDGRSDKTYCCGEDAAEWCCTFWDDSGRLAAVVICLLAVFFVIIFVLIKVCKSVRPSKCSNSVENSESDIRRGQKEDAEDAEDPPPPYPGGSAGFSNSYNNSYNGNYFGNEFNMEDKSAAPRPTLPTDVAPPQQD